jgi:FixJ family two-component response regulator
MPDVSEISVVDDDDSIRESLQGLLKSVGFAVEVFPSAEAFLNSGHSSKTDCLILDIRMPGMSGLELQRRLAANQCKVPIIFITGHGDEDFRSRLRGEGAVDCLLKPFGEEALLDAVQAALRPKRDGVLE